MIYTIWYSGIYRYFAVVYWYVFWLVSLACLLVFYVLINICTIHTYINSVYMYAHLHIAFMLAYSTYLKPKMSSMHEHSSSKWFILLLFIFFCFFYSCIDYFISFFLLILSLSLSFFVQSCVLFFLYSFVYYLSLNTFLGKHAHFETIRVYYCFCFYFLFKLSNLIIN